MPESRTSSRRAYADALSSKVWNFVTSSRLKTRNSRTKEMTTDLVELIDRVIAGDPEADPHAVYAQLRASKPVLRHEGMGVWLIARHADVKRALHEGDSFAPLTEGPGSPIFGRTILQMRGKEHSRKTAIVARRMRNPLVLKSDIQQSVDRIADELLAKIAAISGPVDLRASYTCPLALKVITDMLAVPEGEHWLQWYEALAAGGVSSITGDLSLRERAIVARQEIFSYLGPVIKARRQCPGADLLSDIASIEYEGASLTEEEAKAFVAFLLTAGVETTDRVLSSLLSHLADTPELWEALREDAQLVLPACAEALRMFAPVQALTRQVLEDVNIGGQHIPAGDKLLILLASANRDEALFDNPQQFRLDRFQRAPQREFTGGGSIVSFGGGVHHCTGAQLASVEMESGLRHLLNAFRSLRRAGEPSKPRGFVLRSPTSVRVSLEPT